VLVVGALGLSNASTIVDLLTFVPKIEDLVKVVDIVGLAVGPAIYLTVMGSLVIILSFIACGGVYKKSRIVISIVSSSFFIRSSFVYRPAVIYFNHTYDTS